ncbi:uncharacterized protein LOC103316369 [Nasonia vitripennis]|uniref:Integrase zinc-binding domain-containing protein n=1 Tax=Nasonia vitripennis TaxID=7425 RepID=A0A7M7H5I2_NASVI|nr:uncharacterized protein LOC103316369 [Nasonia vitripennis]
MVKQESFFVYGVLLNNRFEIRFQLNNKREPPRNGNRTVLQDHRPPQQNHVGQPAVVEEQTLTGPKPGPHICAKLSQRQDYGPEIRQLQLGRPISKDSALRTLSSFLDESGLLRVGGRLCNSLLPANEMHPVILCGRSPLAKLIIDWAHRRSLHAGFRSTYSYAIQRAWIVGARTQVRSHIKKCVACTITNARPQTQAMAPLPAARVTPSAAFLRTGVDYDGPFQILCTKDRGIRSTKGYVALFVCMTTKAVHLELVGDLTTQSFLGALDRFTGCRGQPQEIWSDNGTTFQGANVELNRLLRAAEMDWGQVEGSLAQQGITWRFILPSAPHFGGIWEAGSSLLHPKPNMDDKPLPFLSLAFLIDLLM